MNMPVSNVNADAAAIAKAKASVKAGLKRSARLADAFPGAAQLPARAQPPAPAAAPAAAAQETLVVKVSKDDGRTHAQKLVDVTLSPSVGAASAIQDLTHRGHGLDLTTLAWYFKNAGTIAANGDLRPLQEMLAIQARTLDAIFSNFLRRATNAKTTQGMETLLKIAMKAQAQSRCTVESIAAIQQGPAIFAKQANVSQCGPQQVNNHPPAPATAAAQTMASAPTRARKKTVSGARRTIARNQGGNHE